MQAMRRGQGTVWWRKRATVVSLCLMTCVCVVAALIAREVTAWNQLLARDVAEMKALIRHDVPLGSSPSQVRAFIGSKDAAAFTSRHDFNVLGIDDTGPQPYRHTLTASTYDPYMRRYLTLNFYFDTANRLTHFTVEEVGHYIGGPGL